MDSKKIFLIFLSVVWSEVIDQDTTETCDVISAVKCFSNMAEVPKPHMLTGDPKTEILEPCKEQINKTSALRTCLESFLEGCKSVLKDANKLIDISEAFCSNCLACPNFRMEYTAGLNCTLQIFKTLVTPGTKSKQENCKAYSNCLVEIVERCPVLRALSLKIWMFFERTCQRVNVSSPSQLIVTESNPNLICAELDVVTMSLSDCYVTFLKAVGPKENIVVASYCKAVKFYDECAQAVLTRCPLFKKIFKNSISSYYYAIEPFCGNTTDISSVCDLQGLSLCIENTDDTLWRSEKYIIGGLGATVNSQNWSDTLIQIRDAATRFKSTCSKLSFSLNTTNNCINSHVSGCPFAINEAYHMQTDYLQMLCTGIYGCKSAAIEEAIEYCGRTAKLINETTLYCKILQAFVICLDNQLKKCVEPSQNITAFYALIVYDLNPGCKLEELFQIPQNETFSSEILKFLDCRKMPLISYEIGDCTNTYLHNIARHQTSKEEICKALNNWENCTSDVTLGCAVVHTHIQLIVENTRDHLHPICLRPTIIPSQSPDMSDDGQTTVPTNSTSTGGISAVQFSSQRGWTLCLILLLQYWMW